MTTEVAQVETSFAALHDDWDGASRYLSIFIDEAEHTLDELIDALLALEAGGGHENIVQLFVAAHRIKGSAASIGLNRVAKLAHLMEDILQVLVDSKQTLTSEIADAMLAGTDGLRHFVDAMKTGRPGGEEFEALARQLIAAKAAMHQGEAQAEKKEEVEAEKPSEKPDIVTELYDWRQRVAEALRDDEHASTLVGEIAFDPDFPQVGLKARLVYEKLSHLGEIRYFDPPAAELDSVERLEMARFGVVTDKQPDVLGRMLRVAGVVNVSVEPLETPAQSAQRAAAPATTAAIKPAETLRVDIRRLDQLMSLAGQLAINKSRVAQIAEQLKMLVGGGTSIRAFSSIAEQLQLMAEGRASRMNLRADAEHYRHTARRLHQEVEALRLQAESFAQAKSFVNDLFETVHQLGLVSDGIHQSVMDTRMLPIGPLFARFHRVIRDITRANGKEIRLVVSGEKTELDKRMIDELSDPMIHIIRNAADHGIESPEDRAAAGKPRQGTISLDACHRGSNIVIRVSDDGRGLDPDRIRAKAVQRGLVSEADAERMTRQQLHQLIWMPGFSTAEKLTEVSGRGVGMDIVRSKIEALSGTVEIESEPGQGTTMIVKLPLTLAILPSLLVEIGGEVFALPLESVVEIVRVRQSDLSTVRGLPIAPVREWLVPVLTLGSIFSRRRDGRADDVEHSDTILLAVLGEGSRRLGLAVDRVLGEEDVVIKSIAENYRNVAGVAGASILGDGRVSLILDPPTLIEMSSNPIAEVANV